MKNIGTNEKALVLVQNTQEPTKQNIGCIVKSVGTNENKNTRCIYSYIAITLHVNGGQVCPPPRIVKKNKEIDLQSIHLRSLQGLFLFFGIQIPKQQFFYEKNKGIDVRFDPFALAAWLFSIFRNPNFKIFISLYEKHGDRPPVDPFALTVFLFFGIKISKQLFY